MIMRLMTCMLSWAYLVRFLFLFVVWIGYCGNWIVQAIFLANLFLIFLFIFDLLVGIDLLMTHGSKSWLQPSLRKGFFDSALVSGDTHRYRYARASDLFIYYYCF